MADNVQDLLHSATAAVAAARRELAEVERHRLAGVESQIEMATSLSRSKQLSSEQSAMAGDALKYQRSLATTLRAAIDERGEVLDNVNDGIASLIDSIGAGPAGP